MDELRYFFEFPWAGVFGFISIVGFIFIAAKLGWKRTKSWIELPEKVETLGNSMQAYVDEHEKDIMERFAKKRHSHKARRKKNDS